MTVRWLCEKNEEWHTLGRVLKWAVQIVWFRETFERLKSDHSEPQRLHLFQIVSTTTFHWYIGWITIGVITKFVDLCQVSQVIPWYAVAKWKKGVGWWPWLSDDFVKKWRVAHVGKGLEMSSCGYNCLVPWDILKGSIVTIPTHSSCTYSTLQPSITLAELLLSIALWF